MGDDKSDKQVMAVEVVAAKAFKLEAEQKHRIFRFKTIGDEEPDFLIACGDCHLLVHQAVLSAASDFFKNMMTHGMKESTSHQVDLPHKEPRMLMAVIFYIYNGTYNDGRGNEPDCDGPLTINAKVFAYGEEYPMSELKKYAIAKLEKALRSCEVFDDGDFETAASNVHSSAWIHEAEIGMKEVFSQQAGKSYKRLMDNAGFQRAMKNVPGLAADVANAIWEGMPTPMALECPHCAFVVAFKSQLADKVGFCFRCGRKQSDWRVIGR